MDNFLCSSTSDPLPNNNNIKLTCKSINFTQIIEPTFSRSKLYADDSETVTYEGLKWKLFVSSERAPETNNDKRLVGLHIQALMAEENGSHWRCLGNVNIKIPNSWNPFPKTYNYNNVIWTREENSYNIIKLSEEEFKKSYIATDGSINVSVELCPQQPTGFLSEWQCKLRRLMYDTRFQDGVLLPKGPGDGVPCHSSIICNFGGSMVLDDALIRWQDYQIDVDTCSIFEIKVDLGQVALECLVNFIYYKEDFEIKNDPKIAKELFCFAMNHRMRELAECSSTSLSSDTINPNNFNIKEMIECYRLLKINAGAVLSISASQKYQNIFLLAIAKHPSNGRSLAEEIEIYNEHFDPLPVEISSALQQGVQNLDSMMDEEDNVIPK